MTCVAVVGSIGMIDQSFVNKLKSCDTSIKAKQLVVDTIIKCLDCEERMLDFCDCIDALVKDGEMKHTVESFRNGTLAYFIVYIASDVVIFNTRRDTGSS